MIRKDYELIAEAIRNAESDCDAHWGGSFPEVRNWAFAHTVRQLSAALAHDNPRFDSERFRKSCRPG